MHKPRQTTNGKLTVDFADKGHEYSLLKIFRTFNSTSMKSFYINNAYGEKQCDQADWWASLDRRGWSLCPQNNTYLKGLWRHDRVPGDERVGRIEFGRCCTPWEKDFANQPAVCNNANWWSTLDGNNVWALCPGGYFLNGLYKTDGRNLYNIEEGQCCRPLNQEEDGDCYDEDVTTSFDNRGWSDCQRTGYYMTGIYKSNCEEINCIEKFKCCRMKTACQAQAIGVANRLPDKSFSASSSRSDDEPYKGRLNGNGAWSPSKKDDADDFLQIDLGDLFFICALATQGHPLQDEWTKSYKLHLLLTEWIIYKENNTEKLFSGNSRSNQLVKHVLIELPTARAVRFQPIHYFHHKALRVEVYGIKTPVGVPSPPVIKNKKKEISLPHFNLLWSSPDNGRCPFTMYTVYFKVIGSPDKENVRYHINTTAMTNTLGALPLDCDTEYEFAVSAWNQFGEGNLSQPWQGNLITGYPVIVNRKKEVKGSVVVVKWKPCTASLFTIYYREVFSEIGKSHWDGVNVSGHEIRYDLNLSCRKEYEIAMTAWNSTAETPLKSLNNSKMWRVTTLGDKPSAPVILNKETQVSGCDVNLRWSLPEDNGCPITLYTIYYSERQSKNEDSWHEINVTKVTKSEHLLSLKCNTEYAFTVSAWNELGESAISSEWPIKTSKASNSIGQTLSIVVPVGCGALILIVVGVVCFRERRKRKKRRGHKTRRSKSDIVPLLLKETPPQRVIFMEELGQGAFGKVHKGILKDLPKAEVFFKPREQRVEIKEGKVVAIKVLLGRITDD
ncbi:hypothetical protein ACROYT_G002114 [Oculina patagonica]